MEQRFLWELKVEGYIQLFVSQKEDPIHTRVEGRRGTRRGLEEGKEEGGNRREKSGGGGAATQTWGRGQWGGGKFSALNLQLPYSCNFKYNPVWKIIDKIYSSLYCTSLTRLKFGMFI